MRIGVSGDVVARLTKDVSAGGRGSTDVVVAGAGRFRDSGQRLGHGGSVSVLLHDINGDGAIDALVSNGGHAFAHAP